MTVQPLDPTAAPDLSTADLGAIHDVAIDDMIEYVYEKPKANLISYLELYNRYLKQRWDVNELDFTQDAEDWKRMSDAEKQSFLQIASGFHHVAGVDGEIRDHFLHLSDVHIDIAVVTLRLKGQTDVLR